MRKVLLIFFFALFLLCGCNREKAAILFSSEPITKEFTLDKAGNQFKIGQKIYFVLYNPKPYTGNVLKIQVLKADDKMTVFVPTIAHAREIEINPDNPYVVNNFVLHSAGNYWLRVFSRDNLEAPIAEANFKVDSL